ISSFAIPHFPSTMAFTIIFAFILVLSAILFITGVVKDNSPLKMIGLVSLIVNSLLFWMFNSI
ncbi:MAG: hypothetical protein KKE05_06490, partial [Nanoarchaeota archaeon]|nr:hypothetical protein [Nanoarchaeota archaeon]